jgi:hypothetical protein
MSERNTQRMIQHLCDLGWLLIVEKGGYRNGRNVPNKYRILLWGDNLTPHGATEFRHPGGDTTLSPPVVTKLCHPNHHKEPSKETTTTKGNSQPKDKQSVVVASSWPDHDDEPAEIVEKLTEKLKLSYDQSKTVQFYLDQDGKGYVLEKVALTRSKDLRNTGGFFMRALEKDYREPVANPKPPPPQKRRESRRNLKSSQLPTKSAFRPVQN